MAMVKQSSGFVALALALACFLFSAGSTEARTITMDEKQETEYQKLWCIVKPSTPDDQLERNINYCRNQIQHPIYNYTMIENGGPCYLPTNKVSNASVLMHLYYQNAGKQIHNCNFNNSGILVYTDPSVGSCIYPLF